MKASALAPVTAAPVVAAPAHAVMGPPAPERSSSPLLSTGSAAPDVIDANTERALLRAADQALEAGQMALARSLLAHDAKDYPVSYFPETREILRRRLAP
jgi:hypothetical protein